MLEYKPYQERIIQTAPQEGGCCLFLDMGTGKTATALGLANRFGFMRILIVAPLSVAKLTWDVEIAKWGNILMPVYHLYSMGVADIMAFLEKRLCGYFIVNYDKLHALWGSLVSADFDCIIYDESTKLKDPTSLVSRSARTITNKTTAYAMCLTGTPAPENLTDLWAQVYIVDRGRRLGEIYDCFCLRYFRKGGYRGKKWIPFVGSKETITNLIADVSYVMTLEECVSLPEEEEHVITFAMDPQEKQAYDDITLSVLELEDEDVLAANAAIILQKMLQISSGFVYGSNSERNTHLLGSSKTEALLGLLEQIPKACIVYCFQASKDVIMTSLSNAKIPVFTVDSADKLKEIERGVVLLQPKANAHGLNWQFLSNMIFFDLDWSLEKYSQTRRRIRRMGQNNTQHYWFLENCDANKKVKEKLDRKTGDAFDILMAIKSKGRM